MGWAELKETINDVVTNTFGQDVTYYHISGAISTLVGVFTNNYIEVSLGGDNAMSSLKPVLFVQLADLPEEPTTGDKCVLDSVEYKIIDSKDDGGGGTLLVLHKI